MDIAQKTELRWQRKCLWRKRNCSGKMDMGTKGKNNNFILFQWHLL